MLGAPVFRTALFGPWSGNALWTAARAVPSLDLCFADKKDLICASSGRQLVTFARASSGTYVDSTGVLRTAAVDEPRFDHNPLTGESLGLLVEEQRTNSVVNSNSMTAVVTGSPGTLPTGWSAQGNTGGWTREVVGSGSIGALNYVDIRFSGTPTGSQFSVVFQTQGVVAASNGQSWAASVYHQLVGGAISNIGCFAAANLWNSSSAFIGSLALAPNGFNPTSTLQRYTGSGTISLAATAFINWGITFTCTIGNTYDFTIRFAGPGLEQGATASSYIPTTTAAATRNADVASITGTNFSSWYRQDGGTLYAEALTQESTVTTFPRVFSIDDGGAASSFIALVRGNNTRRWDYSVFANGTGQAVGLNNGISPSAGAVCRGAVIYRANDFTGATQGVLMNADTSGIVPTVNALGIGMQSNATLHFNGHIRRLTYWPQALPGQLQAITQP